MVVGDISIVDSICNCHLLLYADRRNGFVVWRKEMKEIEKILLMRLKAEAVVRKRLSETVVVTYG